MKESLSLWEERERRRLEILAAVDRAEASLAHGADRRVTTPEPVKQLAADVERRGKARLNADPNSPSRASFALRPKRRLSSTPSGSISHARVAASILAPE